MDNVTDRTQNPFGMRPPCAHPCDDEVEAVFGYGDPNADFHVIGDHPGVHGGTETGIPFTGHPAGERLLDVLEAVDLLDRPIGGPPLPNDLFLSYLHMCCTPDGGDPPAAAYAQLERFFDAELRAIAAHVLLPVGTRVIEHVLTEFTAKAAKFDGDLDGIHAEELAGRGFLVVPLADPAGWTEQDEAAVVDRLRRVVASDYRQESDLTRFLSTDEIYLVR